VQAPHEPQFSPESRRPARPGETPAASVPLARHGFQAKTGAGAKLSCACSYVFDSKSAAAQWLRPRKAESALLSGKNQCGLMLHLRRPLLIQ